MAKMRELTKAKESLNKAMMKLLLASNFVEDSSEEMTNLTAVADLQSRYDSTMDNLTSKKRSHNRYQLYEQMTRRGF